LFASQLMINEIALKEIYIKFVDSFIEMNKLINKSFLSKEMKHNYNLLLDKRKK
jgi:hypothetical protein